MHLTYTTVKFKTMHKYHAYEYFVIGNVHNVAKLSLSSDWGISICHFVPGELLLQAWQLLLWLAMEAAGLTWAMAKIVFSLLLLL